MNMFKYFSDDNPYCDPPDIYELFQFYNSYFFDNSLHSCTVKWSKRMTLCAGICKYEGQKSCVITLSEPLLQFRSNDDLKSTLLHELIHAFLFITNPAQASINEGHGPLFLEKMHKINQVTGLKLSVYHNFYDEVDRCRNHIWRCNGKCQSKPPFFGYVKRSINRAPGKTDYWFNKHEQECGGIFEKVSEPQKLPKKKIEKKKPKQQQQQLDIKQTKLSNFFTKEQLEVKFILKNKEYEIQFNVIISSLIDFELFDRKLTQIILCFEEYLNSKFIKFFIKKLFSLKHSLEKIENIQIIKFEPNIIEQFKVISLVINSNNLLPKECLLLKINQKLLEQDNQQII